MERDFKGIWIPKELISKLGARKATLISALKSNAPIPNKDLVIREFKREGYIITLKVDEFEVKKILCKKKLKGFGIGDSICEWCSIFTITLHEHHFPIEKQYGGKDIVKICPNCHQEYHSLLNKYSFVFSPEIEKFYE